MLIYKSLPTALIVMMFTVSVSHSAQFTFTPRASAEVEFTDNLFLSNEDEQEDTITTVSAGFTAGLQGRHAGIELSYDPAYAFYHEFTENDGWRHDASGNFFWDMTRHTRFELTDTFILTEDPLSEDDITVLRGEDTIGEFDPTVRTGREQYWRNTANARLAHEFGQYDEIYAEFTHGILENDDPTIEDSVYYEPGAGLTYYFTPQWGFEIGGTYTNGQFDQEDDFVGIPSDDFDRIRGEARLIRRFNPNLTGFLRYRHTYLDYKGEIDEDYTVYDGGAGLEYNVARDITLNLEGGYFYRDNEFSDSDDGWVGLAELIKLFRRGELRLSGEVGYDQASFSAENLGFNEYYRVGAAGNYEIIRRVTIDGFGAYRREEYPDDIDRQDDIYGAGGGLTWEPLLWLSLRGGYSYRQVDSSVDENDYIENRALLTITIEPDQPYRF